MRLTFKIVKPEIPLSGWRHFLLAPAPALQIKGQPNKTLNLPSALVLVYRDSTDAHWRERGSWGTSSSGRLQIQYGQHRRNSDIWRRKSVITTQPSSQTLRQVFTHRREMQACDHRYTALVLGSFIWSKLEQSVQGMVFLQHDSFCYFHPPLSTVTWADSALPWHFWTNTGWTRRVMSAVFSLAAYVSSIRLTGQFGSVKQPDSADSPHSSPHLKRHIKKKPPRESGGGQNKELRKQEALWNCLCGGLGEVSSSVCVRSFRLWENLANICCAV